MDVVVHRRIAGLDGHEVQVHASQVHRFEPFDSAHPLLARARRTREELVVLGVFVGGGETLTLCTVRSIEVRPVSVAAAISSRCEMGGVVLYPFFVRSRADAVLPVRSGAAPETANSRYDLNDSGDLVVGLVMMMMMMMMICQRRIAHSRSPSAAQSNANTQLNLYLYLCLNINLDLKTSEHHTMLNPRFTPTSR